MKKLLHAALLLLFAVLLTVPALADNGPKPKLTIRISHAPAELYYLDLLEQDDDNSPSSLFHDNLRWNYGDKAADLDEELLQAIRDHTPEGWHGCMTVGSRQGPIGGTLYSKESDALGNPVHTFGYMGVPDTYRIITVTESGAVQVSPSYTRQALWSGVTYDYAANTVTVKPIFLAYAAQFLSTFLPTLVIEGVLLLAFRYSLKKNWKPFLLVNLATQLFLTVVCGVSAIRNGVNFFYFFQFIPVELTILAIEALLYRKLLKGQSRLRAVCYAVTANLCSMAAGMFTAYPVFIWIGNHF